MLNDSHSTSGGGEAHRPVVATVNVLVKYEKTKVSVRSIFFSTLSNVYVNGSALGAMKRGLGRSVSLATNISKSNQIFTPSTHTHTLGPLHVSREQTRSLGKRWPPFAPSLAPCIQLREVTEGSLCPSATLPYSRGVHPSTLASITFKDV